MNRILFASALGTALLASTAMQAQNVGVGVDANAGVSVGVGSTGVNTGAGANVGAGAGSSGSGTGAGANVDAGANTNIGSSSAETGVDADLDAEIGVATDSGVDTEIETGATGSAHGSATLSELGIEAQGFFTNETMTELATEAEIRTTFGQLPLEQQAQLQAECAEISMAPMQDNELMAELCAAIEADAETL